MSFRTIQIDADVDETELPRTAKVVVSGGTVTLFSSYDPITVDVEVES